MTDRANDAKHGTVRRIGALFDGLLAALGTRAKHFLAILTAIGVLAGAISWAVHQYYPEQWAAAKDWISRKLKAEPVAPPAPIAVPPPPPAGVAPRLKCERNLTWMIDRFHEHKKNHSNRTWDNYQQVLEETIIGERICVHARLIEGSTAQDNGRFRTLFRSRAWFEGRAYDVYVFVESDTPPNAIGEGEEAKIAGKIDRFADNGRSYDLVLKQGTISTE